MPAPLIGTPDNPLIVDGSTLSAVARCETQGTMRYGLSLTTTEERATLKCGTAVHEALAAWFRGGSKAAALQRFDEAYEAWSRQNILPTMKGLQGRSHPNVRRILGRWLDTHPIGALPYVSAPSLVEIPAQAPLVEDGSLVLAGKLDLLVRGAADGAWWVLDHKSSGQLDEKWRRQWRMSAQISAYTWLAEQHLGERVVGAMLNGIELDVVPSSTKKCPTHALPYAECGLNHVKFELLPVTRSPVQVELWRQTAVKLARRVARLWNTIGSVMDIKQAGLQGLFTGACLYCEFQDWCAAGRNPQAVKSQFVVSPWSPLTPEGP